VTVLVRLTRRAPRLDEIGFLPSGTVCELVGHRTPHAAWLQRPGERALHLVSTGDFEPVDPITALGTLT